MEMYLILLIVVSGLEVERTSQFYKVRASPRGSIKTFG
jgi:hypothetical protein